jgi:portal protein
MKAYIRSEKLPKWYLSYARAMASNYPDMTVADRIQELYKRLSWVATAIDVVSVIGSGAGKSVKKMVGEEEKDIVNHDFELRLTDPNPIQSGHTFIFSLIADFKLHNKSYIWMNLVNNKPVELWRIPPTMIAPKASGVLGIEYFIYDPGYGGQKINIPPEEIVYWSGYDPYNLITPDSSLTSIFNVSANDLQMQKWSQHVYDGNGRLPGVLHFADMINDDQWEQIGEDIDTAAKNQNILRLRGTGSGSIGYIQTSSPPKDMEFYIGRNNNRDEIWNRIAPGLVSMLSENATEANSRSGKATIIDLVVYPLLQMLYECMTQQIIWRFYGTDLKIEPDDIRVTDRVLELSENQEHSKVLTVNEYRYLWGDDDYPDPVIGKMLVTEAQTYKSVQPPVLDGVVVNDNEKPQPQLPAETSNAQTDINAQQEQASTKMLKDPHPTMLELDKWERKAIKNIGKEFDFDCYNTPLELVNSIKAELIGCANPAAVKAIFANARDGLRDTDITYPPMYEIGEIKLLADALNRASDLALMQSGQKYESPVINMTMPPITLTATMPQQGEPSITFSPVIQPAETIVQNTIEVSPTPIENNIELNTPELESSEDVIERDVEDNIKGKKTKYKYKKGK